MGLVVFARPLGDMLGDGLLSSIGAPGSALPVRFDRAAAFWFMLFSPVLVLAGQMTNHAVERCDARMLHMIAWYLIGMGVVGCAVAPISGFWVVIAIGMLVARQEKMALRHAGGALAASS